MAADEKTTWTLRHGIHRGTITSRDSDSQGGFENLEACEKKLQEHEAFYRSIGYVIWFAEAVAPDGTKHQLRAGNTNYR